VVCKSRLDALIYSVNLDAMIYGVDPCTTSDAT
jgi:hypothetical protein